MVCGLLCVLCVGVYANGALVHRTHRREFRVVNGSYLWPHPYREVPGSRSRAQCAIQCMRDMPMCGAFRVHLCGVCMLITSDELDGGVMHVYQVVDTHGPNEFYAMLPPVYSFIQQQTGEYGVSTV